jgi:hypothetical protein
MEFHVDISDVHIDWIRLIGSEILGVVHVPN